MTPAAIIRQAGTEGVPWPSRRPGPSRRPATPRPSSDGYRPSARTSPASSPSCGLFDFAPPTDPENDAEAIEERAAIIAEGCGMGHTQALQEARWQAEREQAWRVFLRNAQRILDASEGARQELVVRYETEAASRYGASVAASMAASMRGWLAARGD